MNPEMQPRAQDPPEGVWAAMHPPCVKGEDTAGGEQGEGEQMPAGEENDPALHVIVKDAVGVYLFLQVGVQVEEEEVEEEQDE